MKRILSNIIIWGSLAAAAGSQIGYHQGYARGVRDIGSLLILLHDGAGELPTASPKRGAGL